MSTGQIVGTITGAAVGFAVGGPTGAVYGAQIGYAAGTALDPPKGPTVEGPRLNDLSVQTSTYGQFIPRTYGTIGLSGNVFWLENNKIKEKVKKKKSGGKGGGSSSTVKTYTYYATFAVGLCEGPIAGVRRIWVGPDLVYDAGSDDLETIISSNTASAKFTIYTGTDIQQPDPRMQAEMGVANCPAFRGLAYIVVKDLKLTDYGNSVAGAQVKVEVINNSSTSGKLIYENVIATPGFASVPGVAVDDKTSSNIIQASQIVLGISNWSIQKYNGGSLSRRVDSSRNYLPGYFSCNLQKNVLAVYENRSITEQIKIHLFGSDLVETYASTGVRVSVTALCEVAGSNDIVLVSQPQLTETIATIEIIETSPLSPENSIVKSSIQITTQFAGPCVLSLDDKIYTFFRPTTSGPLQVKVYDYSLNQIDAFSISLPVEINSVIHGRENPLSSRNGNPFFAFPAIGGIRKFLEIDIISRSTLAVYECPSTSSGQTFPYRGVVRSADGVVSIGQRTTTGYYSGVFAPFQTSDNTVSLSSIFTDEAERSSLIKLADIDASGLTDSVTGFKVTATGSIRNAIEPLRGAWPFDVVQSGYKIKAASRGSASVVTIPIGELAIDTQLTESREMDSQLPQNITVKYIDRDRDYDVNEQRAQRDNTEAVNSLVLELPVVLSATQSAQVADKLIRIYALEKSDFSFTLPAPYRYLEPGDVVTIATDDADYVLRLVSVNQTADGRLECSGRPSSASTYTSIAPGDGGQHGGTVIPLAGATVGIIIDCPVIDESLQDAPGFAVGMNGYSAGWPGGILYRTPDGWQTWDDLQALEGRATAGYASSVLTASAGNLIQRGGTLVVSLIGGTLESVTEAQMLNGANIAAYGVNGRWEIIRFQNATLNANGTYTLDTFWRGDKGTEWATSPHAANDIFVLMTDPDLAFVGMPTDSIGQPRDYRAITAGADIDSAASQSFTYSGVNLETLSGVHPRGSRASGDLTVTWQRRTRVGGAWRDYVDASLGESVQAYDVDIMQGAVVKRTITATTPSVLYTSAQQVTDFGSPQASVTVNIYQLSAVVGRGYKLEATL